MAKKGKRQLLLFVCPECKHQNYISEKSKINTTDKVSLKKYCKWCRKRTVHKESTRLK